MKKQRNVSYHGSECYVICEKDNSAIGSIELKLNGYTGMKDKDDECELAWKTILGNRIYDGSSREKKKLYAEKRMCYTE